LGQVHISPSQKYGESNWNRSRRAPSRKGGKSNWDRSRSDLQESNWKRSRTYPSQKRRGVNMGQVQTRPLTKLEVSQTETGPEQPPHKNGRESN
jgi:hypothetical protein